MSIATKKERRPKMRIPAAHLRGFRKIFGGKISKEAMEQIRREYRKNPGAPGEAFKRCVAAVKAQGSARSPGGVCAAAGREKYGAAGFARKGAAGRKRAAARRRRGNPVETAADRYKLFHGKEADVIVDVETVVHEHGTLSGIGKLVKLVILAIDAKSTVELTGFKGSILSQDEKGVQLFIVGGDQRVNLADFGIKRPHEMEVLGAVQEVWYDTEKKHLRPEDGGKAVYHHKFGGKTRLPLMMYDVRNALLYFAGGEYDMPEVGIRG